jgi:mersacidin/lichenicidin family type 2 lantibiotic
MSHENIIRAWKDNEFRDSLSHSERSLLPDNPVGLIGLTEPQLAGVAGGALRPTVTPRSCEQNSYSGIVYCC